MSGVFRIERERLIVAPEQYQGEQGSNILALKASRCAVPEIVPKNQAQIQRGVLNQDALENVVPMSEVNPTHGSGFQSVRERPFQHQSPLSE